MTLSSQQELQGAIVGLGNPLLDMSADVTNNFLKKYDLEADTSIIAEERHMPLYKELMDHHEVKYTAGGATQNTIRVTQWMIRKPGSTGFMGAVGKDEFAMKLKECVAEDGVHACYQEVDGMPTGTCAVLNTGSERTLVANLGAAGCSSPDHLHSEEGRDMVDKARCYYVASFFLTVSIESVLEVARHAAENNKLFAINLSAPFLVKDQQDEMGRVMPYADYVFGNGSEAMAYGEVKGYGSDVEAIALKLAAEPKQNIHKPRIVVITKGPDAVVVASNGEVKTYPVEKVEKNQIVDTNGAGDAFAGGFLSQLVRGKGIDECVRAGHYALRTIIQQPGCTLPPTCDYTEDTA